jgi:TRAP-type C4-dicarboxylate transport system substrate-binding protein
VVNVDSHRQYRSGIAKRLPLSACAAAALVLATVGVTACGIGQTNSGSSGSGSSSDPQVTLRLGDYLAGSDPWTKWAQDLAAKVSADTSGAVQIKVYPDAQLVSQSGYLQAIRSGSVDLSVAGDSELATVNSDAAGLAVSDVPFRDANWQQADAITLSSEVRDAQNQALGSAGVKILSTCTEGFSALVTSSPVSTIDQLKGAKIRVAAPADADILKALGANPVQIAIGDTYEALQLHTAAGAFSTTANIFGQQWYKVTKNVDLLPIRMANESLVVNSKSMARLSAHEQQVLTKDAADATQSCDDAVQAAATADQNQMRTAGAHMIQPADLQPFVDATAAARDKAESVSPLAKKLTSIEDGLVKGTN